MLSAVAGHSLSASTRSASVTLSQQSRWMLLQLAPHHRCGDSVVSTRKKASIFGSKGSEGMSVWTSQQLR